MQPVTRDSLLLLLWPDTEEATARRNLTRLLSALRHALPDPDILEATRATISINPMHAWSDTAAFAALADSDELPHWEQAVTLYRDMFLSGFSLPSSSEFNAWQSQQQHYYERRFLRILAKIIAAKRQMGKYDEAITLAQRYLLIDELSEEIHCQLINLYGQIGDRSAALRQFEQCALVLERELGVTPLPETRAVYEAVREGDLLAGKIKEPKLAWTTLPSLDIPFIGRETAWNTLNTAYKRLRHGGVISISGEAGVGKSRLIQEFASSCTGLVLSGNNEAAEQTILYQPLIQALRQGLHIPSRWTHVLPIWLAELSRLIPDLTIHFPDLPEPIDVEPQQAQIRMFEAFHQVFASLAVDSPLLFCLDNVHWADASTRGWLQYMSSHLAKI